MSLQLLIDILLATAPLLVIFPTFFALTTWVERKALARIQNRIGPNEIGIPCTRISLFGLGQPAADGIKMLFKEDIVPRDADRDALQEHALSNEKVKELIGDQQVRKVIVVPGRLVHGVA